MIALEVAGPLHQFARLAHRVRGGKTAAGIFACALQRVLAEQGAGLLEGTDELRVVSQTAFVEQADEFLAAEIPRRARGL